MRIILDVNAENFFDSVDLDHDSAFELITKIDAEMQDYEFTERLAKHFIKALMIECEHSPEPFDINELLKD